ncbi:basic leucine zipper 1-like [Panicum virgatum]|uniref:BZIP domain-containing protein n=1 Tax=Panicum virgatum TaxID=38727 RepID=A0A8T0MGB4_PANVG|nr:basic leucine zipper 1-like [Panicum virgatum]KAG2536147.1 hypothetical protein PVAP13_9NG093400 [Panicum virgatum]
MAFSDYYCIDTDGFWAMSPPQLEFGPDPTASPLLPTETTPAAASSPEVEAGDAAAAGCADERRLRRRISNRESARRSRARKQRRLNELRASAAALERRRRELAARAQAARGRLALARLANAGLRAEAAALSRRLLATRRAFTLGRLYHAATITAAAGGSGSGACSHGFVDIEQTIASLIA